MAAPRQECAALSRRLISAKSTRHFNEAVVGLSQRLATPQFVQLLSAERDDAGANGWTVLLKAMVSGMSEDSRRRSPQNVGTLERLVHAAERTGSTFEAAAAERLFHATLDELTAVNDLPVEVCKYYLAILSALCSRGSYFCAMGGATAQEIAGQMIELTISSLGNDELAPRAEHAVTMFWFPETARCVKGKGSGGLTWSNRGLSRFKAAAARLLLRLTKHFPFALDGRVLTRVLDHVRSILAAVAAAETGAGDSSIAAHSIAAHSIASRALSPKPHSVASADFHARPSEVAAKAEFAAIAELAAHERRADWLAETRPLLSSLWAAVNALMRRQPASAIQHLWGGFATRAEVISFVVVALEHSEQRPLLDELVAFARLFVRVAPLMGEPIPAPLRAALDRFIKRQVSHPLSPLSHISPLLVT